MILKLVSSYLISASEAVEREPVDADEHPRHRRCNDLSTLLFGLASMTVNISMLRFLLILLADTQTLCKQHGAASTPHRIGAVRRALLHSPPANTCTGRKGSP